MCESQPLLLEGLTPMLEEQVFFSFSVFLLSDFRFMAGPLVLTPISHCISIPPSLHSARVFWVRIDRVCNHASFASGLIAPVMLLPLLSAQLPSGHSLLACGAKHLELLSPANVRSCPRRDMHREQLACLHGRDKLSRSGSETEPSGFWALLSVVPKASSNLHFKPKAVKELGELVGVDLAIGGEHIRPSSCR
jgi:hypothetical protein